MGLLLSTLPHCTGFLRKQREQHCFNHLHFFFESSSSSAIHKVSGGRRVEGEWFCLPSQPWGTEAQQTHHTGRGLTEQSLQPGSPTSFSKLPGICLLFWVTKDSVFLWIQFLSGHEVGNPCWRTTEGRVGNPQILMCVWGGVPMGTWVG